MNFSRAPNGIKKLAVGPVSGAVAPGCWSRAGGHFLKPLI